MDETGYVKQNIDDVEVYKKIEDTDEYKTVFMNEFKGENLLDEFSNQDLMYGMQANSEMVFEKNALELDYTKKFKSKDIQKLKDRKIIGSQSDADAMQSQRFLFGTMIEDTSMHAYRAKKDRKNRAKEAKKDAIKAKKLLTKKTKTADDAYNNSVEINRLHYEMNVNRIKAIAKNEEQENKLIAKARRAHLVREMENCAKVITDGKLSSQISEKASNAGYAAVNEYIDLLVSTNEITADYAEKVKANTDAMSHFMHSIVLKKTYNIEVRYANYFAPQEYQEGMQMFDEWKATSSEYGKHIRQGHTYMPDIRAFRLAKSSEEWKVIRKRYITEEVADKFRAIAKKAGSNSVDINRDLESSLKYVAFGVDGEPLDEYKEADEWNRKFATAMTMDYSNEEELAEVKKARKEIILNLIHTSINFEGIAEHLNDKDWLVEHINENMEIVSTALTLVDNLCKDDPISKDVFDEIMKEKPELKTKIDEMNGFIVKLNMVYTQRLEAIGFFYSSDRFYAEEEKEESDEQGDENLPNVEMELKLVKEKNDLFSQYKETDSYKEKEKKGEQFIPTVATYNMVKGIIKISDTVKFYQNNSKTNSLVKKLEGKINLERYLYPVDYDEKGNVYPICMNSHDSNLIFLKAMTMKTDTDEEKVQAKNERKRLFEGMLSNIEHVEVFLNSYNNDKHCLGSNGSHLKRINMFINFENDICKNDEISKEAFDELLAENPKIKMLYDVYKENAEKIKSLVELSCRAEGYDVNKGEFTSEEEKADSKKELAGHADYMKGVVHRINKVEQPIINAMNAHFKEFQENSWYKDQTANNAVFHPSVAAYKLSQMAKKKQEMFKHYITDDVILKYNANSLASGGAVINSNSGNVNRMLQEVLRPVEFDPKTKEVLAEFKEADEWNKAYIEAMCMDVKVDKAKAKEARKKTFVDIIKTTVELDDLVEHLEDLDWIANNGAMIKWKIGIMTTFHDDMCKKDPLNAEIFDEIMNENQELKAKYDKLDKDITVVNMILDYQFQAIGYDVSRERYLSDEQKASAKSNVAEMKKTLKNV